MALLSPAFIVGPSLVFFHTPLKKTCPALLVLLGLIGLRFWNVLVFVWFCMCELWGTVCGCLLVVGYLEGCVTGRGYFCKFLLVKLMGAVVSRSVEWCKAICHLAEPMNVIQFFLWIALPGRSPCFSLGEINTMCGIFTAFHKFNQIDSNETLT